jgi:hypothetical protein
MAANEPLLLKYGKTILTTYNLQQARKEFTFDFDIYSTGDPIESNAEIITFLETSLGFTREQAQNAVIIHKNIGEKGLKWHIDNCQLVNFKTAPTYNLEQYIHLEGTKYLYFNTDYKKLPKYTILFYSSTYGKDFMGGMLTLADGVKIRPEKQKGIMMDSREAHMVTPVTSGTRYVTVVKIY